MVTVENVSKSYGKQLLLKDISFKLNRRERVGVVGRNGHGKTTLFRLIAGLEEPDAGVIAKPKNYRIGYLQQEIAFTQPTVRSEAALGLPRSEADQAWRVEKILSGLGFQKDEFDRHPGDLSGGFQVRLNLAKVLLDEHSLLLLDEPNNFLDITSIRWLGKFLINWPGELMLITHDRGFMDKVVTHILGIHRKAVRKIAGDTAKYYTQIAMDEETYEKTRINDERKRKEIEDFIAKFRASAQLVGLVQSRKKTLAKMGRREKLDKIQALDFSFNAKPFNGKYVMSVEHVSFAYDPRRPLIQDLNVTIGARDRVFVIGPNGRGKTTLLKLLAGALKPDAGSVSVPLNVATGYYEQTNVQTLADNNTVLEEVASAVPDQDPKRARFLCGTMMFEGDSALKKISVLSGGEKSRVLLGKILASPINLLLLDEPTNHLDLESSDALLAALDNFDGAVVMVTHNEMFLNALAERLIVFQPNGLMVYESDYQRFLDNVGWMEERDERPRQATASNGEKLSRKEIRRLRSELLAEKSRVLRPLETRIAEAERALETAEANLDRMTQEVAEASTAKAGGRVVELSKSIHRAKAELAKLYAALAPVLEEYEEKKAAFEERLAALQEDTAS